MAAVDAAPVMQEVLEASTSISTNLDHASEDRVHADDAHSNAVGSIGHLLKTAFRQLLEPEQASEAENSTTALRSDDVYAESDRAAKQQARTLRTYLQTTREQAYLADRAEADALKKQGVLLGADVPLGASHLDFDAASLVGYGSLSASMVAAGTLLQKNTTQQLRESGNLPWDTEPVPGGVSSSWSLQSEVPGYLTTTAVNVHREALALSASYGPRGLKHQLRQAKAGSASATLNPADSQELHELDAHGSTSSSTANKHATNSAKQQTKSRVIPGADQRDADAQALARIERKLQFMRNPRHDSSSRWSTRVLTVAADASGSSSSTASCSPAPPHGISSSAGAPQQLQQQQQQQQQGEHGYFLADPVSVEFEGYDVGGVYRGLVLLRNVSALSRRLRVLPPATQHFSVTAVAFPVTAADSSDTAAAGGTTLMTVHGSGSTAAAVVSSGGSGSLAPGMAARVYIEFRPDSLSNYSDKVSLADTATLIVAYHGCWWYMDFWVQRD
jgi:hypothetical protein